MFIVAHIPRTHGPLVPKVQAWAWEAAKVSNFVCFDSFGEPDNGPWFVFACIPSNRDKQQVPPVRRCLHCLGRA